MKASSVTTMMWICGIILVFFVISLAFVPSVGCEPDKQVNIWALLVGGSIDVGSVTYPAHEMFRNTYYMYHVLTQHFGILADHIMYLYAMPVLPAISSGVVAQVTRTTQGQGLQSNAWNCPETGLNPTDAIVVRVYQKIGNDPWQLAATFTTEQLDASQLNATTWTIHYYTKLSWIYIPRWEIERTEARFIFDMRIP